MWATCNNVMGSGGAWGMMIGATIVWLLTIILLILGIAALIKYLRSGPPA